MTVTERPQIGQTPTQAPARRNLSIPQVVGGGVLVLIGILWLLERTGAIDVSVTVVLGLATMVVGISLMVLARDRAHGGLIVFGTLLALVALLTAAAPFEGFQGGVGDRTVVVSSVDEIRPDYNQAIGALTIDLRQVSDLGSATRLTASVGMGDLTVRVPEGTPIEVEAGVGAGQIEILGRVTEGVSIDDTYESTGFAGSEQSLSLDLQAFTGRVEVTDE
ncbi:MAG TPA: LiaF domain-containing protein [Acidimicrobiia bacterium]|nr:LiaF domain-containing protein [Acidimicrobiia bacterium]